MKLKDSLIIIFVFVIAIVLGIFVGIKITEEKSDSKPVEGGNQKEFTLTDAENLMNRYKLSGYCGTYYITDLKDADSLAIQRVKTDNTVKCDDVKDAFTNISKYFNEGAGDLQYENCIYSEQYDNQVYYLYDYEDVLNVKKELFGNESELKKEPFFHNPTMKQYAYSESRNAFVSLAIPSGCIPVIYELGIKSYKLIDDTVEIIAYNKGVLTDNSSSTDIHTETYKYQFKQANNSYYLVDIIKAD